MSFPEFLLWGVGGGGGVDNYIYHLPFRNAGGYHPPNLPNMQHEITSLLLSDIEFMLTSPVICKSSLVPLTVSLSRLQ